ncbi:HIT family protein [Erysipelotrichaceae bacterium AF15-26LB]|nr:histidine triad domain protein [Erysipelotrichaceae bacterium 3_1_53]MCR0349296.1 HIT family protein [[Clostridium] innocuum]RJV88812.1 HIT family protein [Erysipelotrichaceae bacterium AF15-26LB]RJV90404.1 HIT family protein [Erysipelotrichaceae bacterium AF19-24AC]
MCIFCSIVNGEIPSSRIYEDDTVIAILDISQVTKGHTLVIPKQHTESFMSCNAELMKHVMEVAQMLSIRIMERTHAAGMNILSNINEAAGQSVMHFHVHLIPRYSEQDACVIRFDESAPVDLDEVAALLR